MSDRAWYFFWYGWVFTALVWMIYRVRVRLLQLKLKWGFNYYHRVALRWEAVAWCGAWWSLWLFWFSWR